MGGEFFEALLYTIPDGSYSATDLKTFKYKKIVENIQNIKKK